MAVCDGGLSGLKDGPVLVTDSDPDGVSAVFGVDVDGDVQAVPGGQQVGGVYAQGVGLAGSAPDVFDGEDFFDLVQNEGVALQVSVLFADPERQRGVQRLVVADGAGQGDGAVAEVVVDPQGVQYGGGAVGGDGGLAAADQGVVMSRLAGRFCSAYCRVV